MKIFALLLGVFLIQFTRYLAFAGAADWLTNFRFKAWSEARRIQKTIPPRSQMRLELKRSFGTAIVLALLLTVGSFFSDHLKIYQSWTDYPWWWIPVSFAILALVHDTSFYWIHRGLHHPKIFRRAHHVHHYSTNPTPYTSYSFHPIETILEFLWIPAVLAVIPVHQSVLLTYSFVAIAMNTIGHLGIEMYPERWLRHPVLKWLNRSTDHNLHHQYFKGNYGLYFRFWDVWMNTELKTSRPRDTRRTPSEACHTPLAG